ncbi:MAG: Gfo/Idh/MocA family protein [Phycisphaeraceae bacterium]
MSSDVRIGLIGCGHRLCGLAKSLLTDRPGLRVTAVCDPSAEARQRALALAEPNATEHEDHHALLAADHVDWVMIGSPNAFHREHAVAAMEAGKDVFCEKPLATTMEDCIAMREAHERTGKRFFIGFTLRYSPHYTRLQQLVSDGAIGDIISMEMNETLQFNHGAFMHQDWRRLRKFGGPFLLEKCCHDIDIANWLTGSLATRVASFGGRNFFLPENAHHVDRVGPDPRTGGKAFMTFSRENLKNPFTIDQDVIDNQVAILEFANQVRMTFFLHCSAGQPQRRSYICGTEGSIDADAVAGEIRLKRIGWNEPTVLYDTKATGGHGGSDPVLTDGLAQCMLEGAPERSGLSEGFKSAVTCLAIDEAMQKGTLVDLRPWWEKLGIETDAPAETAARA